MKGRKARAAMSGFSLSNRLDQGETARAGGGDQEMKVLNDMNELQQFQDDVWSKGSV